MFIKIITFILENLASFKTSVWSTFFGKNTAFYQSELYLTTAMYKTREHLEFNSSFIILIVIVRFLFGYIMTKVCLILSLCCYNFPGRNIYALIHKIRRILWLYLTGSLSIQSSRKINSNLAMQIHWLLCISSTAAVVLLPCHHTSKILYSLVHGKWSPMTIF